MNRVMQRPMFMAKGGESFPDLSGDGKITKKDILMGRGVIPREMQQGGIAAMMPMPMAAPAPEMQVAEVEQMADQQGQMLGGEYLRGMMTGIDSAQTTDELIDAIRGNDRTLQQRYDELASFVGEADASATPESVLTLVQPTLMMTEQGALDTGIGELMQGIAGEVEMETEEGMPTAMGEGIGELMMAQSVPEMQDGGVVQKFQDGQEVMSPQDIFALGLQQGLGLPSATRIEASAQQLTPLFEQMLGTGQQARDLARLQIFTDIANRGLALASGVNPETGQPMEGNLVSQVAQAAAGAPRVIGAATEGVRRAEQQAGQLALQQAINTENLRQKSLVDARLRQMSRAPEFYEVTDAQGNRTYLDANDPTDAVTLREAREGGDTIAKVASVTQPTPQVQRNVVIDGRVKGTIDASRTADIPANIRDLLGLSEGEDLPSYTLENISTTGETYSPGETVLQEAGAREILDLLEKRGVARDNNRRLQTIQTLLDEGNFQTGAFAEQRQFLAGINRLLNEPIDLPEQFQGEEFASSIASVANQLLIDTISETTGIRGTNLVLQTLEAARPQLSTSPEGNELIIQIQKDLNDHAIRLGDLAADYRAAGGPMAQIGGKTFDEAVEELIATTPAVSEELMAKIQEFRSPTKNQALVERVELDFNAQDQYENIEDFIEATLSDSEKLAYNMAKTARNFLTSSRDDVLSRSRPYNPPGAPE